MKEVIEMKKMILMLGLGILLMSCGEDKQFVSNPQPTAQQVEQQAKNDKETIIKNVQNEISDLYGTIGEWRETMKQGTNTNENTLKVSKEILTKIDKLENDIEGTDYISLKQTLEGLKLNFNNLIDTLTKGDTDENIRANFRTMNMRFNDLGNVVMTF